MRKIMKSYIQEIFIENLNLVLLRICKNYTK